MSRLTNVLPKDGEVNGLTHADFKTLFERSAEAQTRAYCPYSNFRVGAVILTTTGDIYIGANVENASYPVGVCAERVALGTAVIQGLKFGMIKAIGVAADLKDPVSPCGMCRQALSEFCHKEVPIVMLGRHKGEERYIIKTMGEVLQVYTDRRLEELPSAKDELTVKGQSYVDIHHQSSMITTTVRIIRQSPGWRDGTRN